MIFLLIAGWLIFFMFSGESSSSPSSDNLPLQHYDWKIGKAETLRLEEEYNARIQAEWLARLNVQIKRISKEEARAIYGRMAD